MNKIRLILLIVIIIIISYSVYYFFYSTDKYGNTPVLKLFYSVSHNKNYNAGKFLVKYKWYNPTFFDVQMLYVSNSKINFDYLAWIMEETNMRIPYVMISKNPQNTQTEDIDWFLTKGIDINNYNFVYPRYLSSINHFGTELITPLSLANSLERNDLVIYLLENGANPNMSNLQIKNMHDCFGKTYYELTNSDKYVKEYSDVDSTLRKHLEYLRDDYGVATNDELIETLKKYEVKYTKEHPNWKNEWVFDW